MAEYIDREKLVQWLKKAGSFLKIEQDHKCVCHVIGKIIDHIEAIPTADVAEVRHGEWIANRSPVEVEFMCSECGFSYIEADSYQECDYNYCPICGARMDGDTE